MLSNGQSTAGELSDIADVPRSRSYDVLESLEKKGFVVSKKGNPAKYLSFSPGEAINNAKQKKHGRCKNRNKKNRLIQGSASHQGAEENIQLKTKI